MISLLILTTSKKRLYDFLKKEYVREKHYIASMQPAKTEYSIDQIRALAHELVVQQAYMRIYVLEDFDRSSLEAQNAFLKLLEEPPANVRFVLHAEHARSLLPTIHSRIKIISLDAETHKMPNANLLALINRTGPQNMNTLIGEKAIQCPDRETAEGLITTFIEYFRTRMRTDTGSSLVLKELVRCRLLLMNNNTHPQLTVDHLLIFINRCYNDYNRYKSYKK